MPAQTHINLGHRHYGVHTDIKEIVVPRDLVLDLGGRQEPVVNEEVLIDVLPEKFLPSEPSRILLLVSTGVFEGQAVWSPKLFRPWGPSFDSLALTVTPWDIQKARERRFSESYAI